MSDHLHAEHRYENQARRYARRSATEVAWDGAGDGPVHRWS